MVFFGQKPAFFGRLCIQNEQVAMTCSLCVDVQFDEARHTTYARSSCNRK